MFFLKRFEHCGCIGRYRIINGTFSAEQISNATLILPLEQVRRAEGGETNYWSHMIDDRKLASVMPLLYNVAHIHRTHFSKYGFCTATGQWSNLAKKAEFLAIKLLKSRHWRSQRMLVVHNSTGVIEAAKYGILENLILWVKNFCFAFPF